MRTILGLAISSLISTSLAHADVIKQYTVEFKPSAEPPTTAVVTYFRNDTAVVIADSRKKFRDTWFRARKDADAVGLTRVVPDLKGGITFTPGELVSLGVQARWSQLQSLFSPEFTQGCSTAPMDAPLRCTLGTDGWPTRVEWRTAKSVETLTLVEPDSAVAYASWIHVPGDWTLFAGSDMGDMEGVPALEELIRVGQVDQLSPQIQQSHQH
jgi:hypothetical protein